MAETMDREEAERLLRGGKEGIKEWNRRREAGEEIPDLSYANLNGAKLSFADLSEAKLSFADLRRANLSKAKLSGANFIGADLREADLREANLFGANLHEAELIQADLIGADLSYANFSGANLREAAFANATCRWTSWGAVDLSSVKGLETVEHFGPSTVGVDTLFKSQGKIPDAFLRGCGVNPVVQKLLLGDAKALTNAAYEASSDRRAFTLQRCFISYSTKDKPFVERLQEALNSSGVDYWYAPEHAIVGRQIKEQIDKEISLRDRMILVCSESSLNDSDWVKYEVTRCVKIEDERRANGVKNWRMLIPVMIDQTFLNWDHHLQPRLAETLAADFRGATKGTAFAEVFERLLRGLQADE